MIKKIAMTAAAGAVMLAAAVPAFAAVNFGALNGNTLQVNSGSTHNTVTTTAKTGGNVNAGLGLGVLQSNKTGDATAVAGVQNTVNTNVSSCGCASSSVNVGVANGNTVQANMGRTTNTVKTSASTGGNANLGGGLLVGQSNNTGDAGAESVVVNTVNTNMN